MKGRSRRSPQTRTVVRLPDGDLGAAIARFAAPLLDALVPMPPPEKARAVIEIAVEVWNASNAASGYWGAARPERLAALLDLARGADGQPWLADTIEVLSKRWRRTSPVDPRLVARWSFEIGDGGGHHLVCEPTLPEGVDAHVPPPAEKRIAIGGRFLDEVQIRLSATSFLSFPVDSHRGVLGDDGVATVYTKMPSALQLLADGVVPRIGGEAVEVVIGGRQLGPMVLTAVSCTGEGGRNDVAVLVFRRADVTG